MVARLAFSHGLKENSLEINITVSWDNFWVSYIFYWLTSKHVGYIWVALSSENWILPVHCAKCSWLVIRYDCPLGARIRVSPVYGNREWASSLNLAIYIQWHCLWTTRLAVQVMRTMPVKARLVSDRTLDCIRLYSMARVEQGKKIIRKAWIVISNRATIKCQVCQQHWRCMAQINVS